MGDTGHDERDFGAILAEFESGRSAREKDPQAGDKVSGKVLSIGAEAVFVDVGSKSDAVVGRGELTDEHDELTVSVGDTVQGLVIGHDAATGCLVLRVKPGASSGLGAGGTAVAVEEIAQAHAHGIPVEGTVTELVKGGVQVTVSGLRAFCPVSQLEIGYVTDPATYVGRRLTFLVRRFHVAGPGRRADVVLSRRDLLEDERRRQREETLARLTPGAVVRGPVTSVTTYGAFVDVGGIEGLLHVSEMSYDRVGDPAEVLTVGELLDVKVLSIEEKDGETRISLSRRALEQDPWKEAESRFPEGATVPGRVSHLEPFGAFVRLAPGLEGLIHVSELGAERRVSHAREVLQLGQDVEARVLAVDVERRRISLSLAGSGEDAEPASVEEYQRREKETKGFGSMADFFDKAKKG